MRLICASYPYQDPFGLFDTVMAADATKLQAGDCLLLWGGEDIDPALYGQKPNARVHVSRHGQERSEKEIELIKTATRLDLPIIGVCRGAQLLTAITGGELMQHIEEHHTHHTITVHETGEVFKVNSCHHQACLPVDPAIILASTGKPVRCVNEYNEADKLEEVHEIIYFPQIRALGFQFHPEWQDCPQKTVALCAQMIKSYLLEE